MSPLTAATSHGGSIYAWGSASVEGCIRDGNALNAELRLDMSPSKINHLARRYIKHVAATGTSFRDYMLDVLEHKAEKFQPELIGEARIFLHPDPTGEHAVNRIKNEQKRAKRRTSILAK